jgi:hypothetical protein
MVFGKVIDGKPSLVVNGKVYPLDLFHPSVKVDMIVRYLKSTVEVAE